MRTPSTLRTLLNRAQSSNVTPSYLVMVKITKRVVEAAEPQEKDYLIWDEELSGFGLRVFNSGKRSYVIQYRIGGRSRRYTIGFHGAWAPETAHREAKVQLGRVAGGDDPVEDRQLDHKAITVKELCARYFADLQAGLILGKGGTAEEGLDDRHRYPPYRAAHRSPHRNQAGQGPHQSRHQQGP
jgi:Arm DNA-binding domain